jgi:hypothetical protein
MNPGLPSRSVFAESVGFALSKQLSTQSASRETPTQWPPTSGSLDGYVVSVQPEVDFVPGLDAKLVTEIFGDDYLALGANLRSHTVQYNQGTG